MNTQVNLTKRVTVQGQQRYCAVVMSANGRVKPDVITVDKKEEVHKEGSYYIEWRAGAKRVRKAVGTDAQDAAAAKAKKLAELNATNHGVIVVAPEAKATDALTLAAAVANYLTQLAKNHKPATVESYTLALQYFLESCNKATLSDVTAEDMLDYSVYLKTECELSARTTYNKFLAVQIFLKKCGVRGLVSKDDVPSYTEDLPTIYADEELAALFGACDDEEKLLFQFFLCSGFRDQEVRYLCWGDVNFATSEVSVTHKPQWGWQPKAYKPRRVPLSTKMLDALKAWKLQSVATCPLVFPTGRCNPRWDFLTVLKRIAAKAGVPDSYLHKFRATFATKCLWAGVDIRTTMSWLGHSDLESTLRYLRPNQSVEVRAKVNQIFG